MSSSAKPSSANGFGSGGTTAWRAAPIKSLGQYLGKKQGRGVGGGGDAQTVSGATMSGRTSTFLHHHHHCQRLYSDDEDDYDDEERLVTAMYHAPQQEEEDEEHLYQSEQDFQGHNTIPVIHNEEILQASSEESRTCDQQTASPPGKRKPPSRTNSLRMRSAMKQFFGGRTIRFGKRKEQDTTTNTTVTTTVPRTEEDVDVEASATSATTSSAVDMAQSQTELNAQEANSSFSSSSAPAPISSTSSAAITPQPLPSQRQQPSSLAFDDPSTLASTLVHSPTESPSQPRLDQQHGGGDDDTIMDLKRIPSKVSSKDESVSMHSMTLQQAMMVEPSAHSRASGSSHITATTASGDGQSRYGSSNITIKMSNKRPSTSSEGGVGEASEYLQLQLSAAATNDDDDENIGLSQLEQQQHAAPKRRVSTRSSLSVTHDPAGYHHRRKASTRKKSSQVRRRPSKTVVTDESSVLPEQRKHTTPKDELSSSQSTDSDHPLRRLERAKQRSTRKLRPFIEEEGELSNAVTTAFDRRTSSRHHRNPSFRTVQSSMGESTAPMTSSPRRCKTSLGRHHDHKHDDGVVSLSPRRVKSAMRVDPIISPRPHVRRINSVEPSSSKIRSATERRHGHRRRPSDVRPYKKTPSRAEDHSVTTTSPLTRIPPPDLSICSEQPQQQDKEGMSPSAARLNNQSRSLVPGNLKKSPSFRSTTSASRSKSTDASYMSPAARTEKTKAAVCTPSDGEKGAYRSPLVGQSPTARGDKVRRSPGTLKSKRKGAKQEDIERLLTEMRSRSKSPVKSKLHHSHHVPSPTKRTKSLELSSKSHSHSGERHTSDRRSRAKSPTGECQVSPYHLRKKIHHSRSQDVWLTQTPTPGPSKSLAAADLRKVPHSEGRAREMYSMGRRGHDPSMTLEAAPNLEDKPKAPRRGTRSGHKSSRKKETHRHRSSSPRRSANTTSRTIARHRSQSRSKAAESSSTSTTIATTNYRNALSDHLVATNNSASQDSNTCNNTTHSSACESTAES